MTGIVRIGPGDAKPMSALHARCFPNGWSARDIDTLLRQSGVAGFKSVDGQGFILIRRVIDEAEILTICVDPAKRRSGLGRDLLDAGIHEVANQGATRILLDVSVNNLAAYTLYQNAGFAETGRRRAYYADGSDAILMEKHHKAAATI